MICEKKKKKNKKEEDETKGLLMNLRLSFYIYFLELKDLKILTSIGLLHFIFMFQNCCVYRVEVDLRNFSF